MSTPNRGQYQDGVSALSETCQLSLMNGNLYIYLTEQADKLLIWNLKQFHSCAFQGSTLIIFFGNEPYQTLECTGDLAVEIYNLVQGIPSETKNTGSRKINRTILWMIVFAIVFFIFSWLYFIPWLGEKSATLIPVDLEIKLGEGIAGNMSEGSETNDSATYYANEFLKLLQTEETYPISIQVIKSEDLNAFAMPGGKIIIYSALLDKMNTPEELVALLGHELTHINERHSLKSICRSLASSIVLSTFFGNAGGISSSIINQVDQFKSLNYSRELETEADLRGLAWMVENKVDPKGMLRLLSILKESSEKEPDFMKYLSTHPDTEARIQSVTSEIKKELIFTKNENLEIIFNALKANL